MTAKTAAPAPAMSAQQAAAFEALVLQGTAPKAVNTAQSLIRRGIVEVDADGDLSVTPEGWAYARTIGLVAADEKTVEPEVDFPVDEPNLPAEDETTKVDKKAAKKATKKADKPAAQTLRIPEVFGHFLRNQRGATGVQRIVERVEQGEVDPKDKSVRIEVSDADLRLLLAQANKMREAATDASMKRVAIARVRWIEKMLAAKA